MEPVKVHVNRIYIAYGYYLEWYSSVDGAKANSGLSELWIGKDDMEYREFILQFDISETSEINRDYLLQSVFPGAIYEYAMRFSVLSNAASVLDEHGIREMEYDFTRYYLFDDYYIDMIEPDAYDKYAEFDEDDDMEDFDYGSDCEIILGKVNCASKVSIGLANLLDVKEEERGSKLGMVLELSLKDFDKEELDFLFSGVDDTIDYDVINEDEITKSLNIYFDLASPLTDSIKDDSDDSDVITF